MALSAKTWTRVPSIASSCFFRYCAEFRRSHALVEAAVFGRLVARNSVLPCPDFELHASQMFNDDLHMIPPERFVAGHWDYGPPRAGSEVHALGIISQNKLMRIP